MKILTLEEFNKEYIQLAEDTMNALNELKDLTNKDVVFKLVTSKEAVGHFNLKVKLARNFMKNHIILINTDRVVNREELNYTIIHEVMHGLRVFSAKPQDRKVLATNYKKQEQLREVLYKDTSDVLKNAMPKANLYQYLDSLITNVNMVLFNNSVDARIELEIYEKYPNTRSLQRNAQIRYVNELVEPFINNNVKITIPNWILHRVNLMNYCYLIKVSPIIGDSWRKIIDSRIDTNFKNTVEKMMVSLNEEDRGQITDTKTIEAWSKILDMKDFVYEVDFEQVPFGYENSN